MLVGKRRRARGDPRYAGGGEARVNDVDIYLERPRTRVFIYRGIHAYEQKNSTSVTFACRAWKTVSVAETVARSTHEYYALACTKRREDKTDDLVTRSMGFSRRQNREKRAPSTGPPLPSVHRGRCGASAANFECARGENRLQINK